MSKDTRKLKRIWRKMRRDLDTRLSLKEWTRVAAEVFAGEDPAKTRTGLYAALSHGWITRKASA